MDATAARWWHDSPPSEIRGSWIYTLDGTPRGVVDVAEDDLDCKGRFGFEFVNERPRKG